MLRERAGFELQCVATQVRVLDRYQGGPATLVGAEGCGRQSMYQRRLRYSYQQGGRTTQNTKWERAALPSNAFVAPPPSAYLAPSQYPVGSIPVATPPAPTQIQSSDALAPQQAPAPVAPAVPAPPAPPSAPPATPTPTRIFGSAAPAD